MTSISCRDQRLSRSIFALSPGPTYPSCQPPPFIPSLIAYLQALSSAGALVYLINLAICKHPFDATTDYVTVRAKLPESWMKTRSWVLWRPQVRHRILLHMRAIQLSFEINLHPENTVGQSCIRAIAMPGKWQQLKQELNE